MDGQENSQSLLRALCVDDDKTAFEILSLFLSEQYSIDFASTGKMALEMLQAGEYSVIFLDINLGRDTMDGLELLRLLREIPSYRKTPVIALTAYAMIGDKEEFLAAGCDYYVPKPFNRASLLEVLSKIKPS
jgi:CheY-like chemotaxis protein